MKTYKGNHPGADEGWEMFKRLKDSDGVEWALYRKSQAHTEDWFTYKISAIGRATRKANYWLARNSKTGQIGFNRDFAMMREHRPALHQMVESVIRETDTP